eukprot:COSAG02_NODE_60761_length_270_cov_0.900585_1_plen_44_part_01
MGGTTTSAAPHLHYTRHARLVGIATHRPPPSHGVRTEEYSAHAL